MDYLNKVLGIKITYSNVKIEHLPNFIVSRYRVQPVFIDKQKAIFLYPKTELEQVDALKKHIARIQEKYINLATQKYETFNRNKATMQKLKDEYKEVLEKIQKIT